MKKEIVELVNISKTYPLGNREVKALKDFSLTIDRGEFMSIAGPSGSGKTTALNMIGCVDIPTSGLVRINGQSTTELSDDEQTELRHKTIGFIFQSFNLIPVLNVYENIEFPLFLNKRFNRNGRDWINYLLEEVGLSEWAKHKPNELSGGQRQRVAVARALATRPEIILADEPTANLDSVTGDKIISLMSKINKEFETTFIFSTHDMNIVSKASRVVTIKDGSVESDEIKEAVNAVCV
ncbi:MAG TPA: ABC transporter ATP-binding protein [bacterium]|nr:ABC transporter ATP-binding protein [bacterium]